MNRHVPADVMLVIVSLLAGGGWIFSKEALVGLDPLLFVGIRFLAGAVLVGVVGRVALTQLSLDQWLRAGVTGAVLGLQLLFWIFGLHHTQHVGVGAFLASLGFVLVPIIGRVFFGTRSTVYTWAALLVALVGLGFLMIDEQIAVAGSDSLLLASAIAAAFHFNLNSRFTISIPALPSTVIQLAVVGLLALALSAWFTPTEPQWNLSLLGWLAASVILATCLRYFLFLKALRTAPLGHGAVIMTLEPVWAALLAAALYAERMTFEQLTGCALIFGALLVSFYGRISKRKLLAEPNR